MLGKQNGFAEVNGTKLYYEVSGVGPPLVLVHGFSLDCRMWEPQVAPLGRRHRLIRYDARGFGRSGLPSGPYTHADDLKALLGHLNIPVAAVCGLSKGGAIAAEFAIAYPDMVKALVLVDAIIWGIDAPPGSPPMDLAPIARAARAQGVDAARSLWLRHPLFAPAMERPEAARALSAIVAGYSGWHWLNRDTDLPFEPPAGKRLASIKAPTLALVGDRDLPLFLHVADTVAKEVPGARKIVIPGAGHTANMEAPEVVNPLVLEFLAGMR